MTEPAAPPQPRRSHGLRRLVGRDVNEAHRGSTPLELLFDLTFVVAFGQAADELAHYLAEGEVRTGVLGFGFATFGVCWAWINYSWFASAYDEDDWFCRVATMVQMVGVIVLALGLPEAFATIGRDVAFDNRVAVIGYIVMRVPMILQWLRASRQDDEHRDACLLYATTIGVSQLGWTGMLFLQLHSGWTLVLVVLGLTLIEVAGPVLAERRKGGIPWHAHHLSERYGLLVIITLGEGVIGTVASLSAIVHPDGWSTSAALLAVAGIGLTFGLWWTYFIVPSGEVLHRHRERVFGWGYLHMVIFGSLAAVGAGLHAAAYYIDHHSHLSTVGTMLTVAIPVGVYIAALYVLYSVLLREIDPFHTKLLALTSAVLVLSVVLAASGVDLAWCLVVLALAPVVTIVGYETLGHRHQDEAVARQLSR